MSWTNLQMPERIEVDEASYSNTFGRFTIQPLEKGFGVTIGNMFRRVLLSSLQGAAITAVKVNNIQHEFSTIPGVFEDFPEITLNLKELRIKLLNKRPDKMILNLKGPMEFTGKTIQEHTTDFEVLNPELHIATLNDDAVMDIELHIGRGRGYVTAEENKAADQTIGLIPIDSIFSPILNVKYLVENTRVGQRTDFEKLILEIETDGSITPDDALTFTLSARRAGRGVSSLGHIAAGQVLAKKPVGNNRDARHCCSHNTCRLARHVDTPSKSPRGRITTACYGCRAGEKRSGVGQVG